jgi:predicted metal-binding protein
MKTQHRIFVCTTCASKWENGKRVGESGGEMLFNRLQDYNVTCNPTENKDVELLIEPVECMSACSRYCVISFAYPGKYTYLFGDVPSQVTPEELAAIFDCAKKYQVHSQGLLPWSERPEPLKKGILAKIPGIA